MEDHDLVVLSTQMLNLKNEFKKTLKELSQIFTSVNGDMKKVRSVLEKKVAVIRWTPLEDLALTEPETSVEFQVLLQEKGWVEIVSRRNFLKANPVFDQEFIDQTANQ